MRKTASALGVAPASVAGRRLGGRHAGRGRVDRRRRRPRPSSPGRRAPRTPTRRRSSAPPLEEDVTAAGLAAQPDVGAEPVDQPACRRRTDARRRRRTTSPRSSSRTGGSASGASGYQRRGRPCAGTRSRVVAGSSSRSTGVTSTDTSGWVAASWAMTPPDRVSDPVSLSGGADGRRARTASPSARVRRPTTAPGAPLTTTPGHDPDVVDARSPRRRRCAAR